MIIYYKGCNCASYGHPLEIKQIREAWALVTANPILTIRKMAEIMGVSHHRSKTLFYFLRDAGYIQKTKKYAMGHKIIIPLRTAIKGQVLK